MASISGNDRMGSRIIIILYIFIIGVEAQKLKLIGPIDKFGMSVGYEGKLILHKIYNELGLYVTQHWATHYVEKNGQWLICDKTGRIAAYKNNHTIVPVKEE